MHREIADRAADSWQGVGWQATFGVARYTINGHVCPFVCVCNPGQFVVLPGILDERGPLLERVHAGSGRLLPVQPLPAPLRLIQPLPHFFFDL